MFLVKQLRCCLPLSNLSVGNFELELSSAAIVFEAMAKSSGPRSDSDLTSRGSGSNSATQTRRAGFSLGFSNANPTCRERTEFLNNGSGLIWEESMERLVTQRDIKESDGFEVELGETEEI